MKKPYIYPEALVVGLSAVSPLAVSNPDIKTTPSAAPVQGKDLDVKENKNIWDEEW